MNRAGLDALDRRIHVVEGHAAQDVADDARRFAPVDEGELVASIRADGSRVWVTAGHWAAVEYGTRPHVIRSKGPWPLRDRETGAVFGRTVHHPGTPAQPYMRPALMRWRQLR